MNDYSKITALYSRMIEDVENGKVGVCIMKDMTRWGREVKKRIHFRQKRSADKAEKRQFQNEES